jgi:hypothetical protein
MKHRVSVSNIKELEKLQQDLRTPNCPITHIHIANKNFDQAGLTSLVAAIAANKNIRELYFSDNTLPEDCSCLVDVIKNNPKLQNLYLSRSGLNATDAQSIITEFAKLANGKVLSLSGNRFKDTDLDLSPLSSKGEWNLKDGNTCFQVPPKDITPSKVEQAYAARIRQPVGCVIS